MKSLRVLLHAAAVVSLAACASGGGGNNSTVAPTPDPRVALKPGLKDAGQAAWNLKLLTNVPPSEKFVGSTNSDLSFYKNYVIQGNYNGFEVWDITTPSRPTLKDGYYCPASQSDVSVFRNLLFVSGEGTGGRLDCGGAGDGRDRELATDLRFADPGADPQRDAAGHRRRPPPGGLSASARWVHGDALRDGAGCRAALHHSAARQYRQGSWWDRHTDHGR